MLNKKAFLISVFIAFNILSIVVIVSFALIFFKALELTALLSSTILLAWAVAILYLYIYKMTNFPEIKTVMLLFYNCITNVLLYFVPIAFNAADIFYNNKILFIIPLVNFILILFFLIIDYKDIFGIKTKSQK